MVYVCRGSQGGVACVGPCTRGGWWSRGMRGGFGGESRNSGCSIAGRKMRRLCSPTLVLSVYCTIPSYAPETPYIARAGINGGSGIMNGTRQATGDVCLSGTASTRQRLFGTARGAPALSHHVTPMEQSISGDGEGGGRWSLALRGITACHRTTDATGETGAEREDLAG